MQIEKTNMAAQASEVRRVTRVGLVTNILLASIKLVGGVMGASQAVLADGFHSLSDCTTDVAILFGVRYWSAPPDRCHPYGHRRIETIITVFIGLVLFATAVGLCFDAIASFGEAPKQKPGAVALSVTITSIIVKELLFRWTRRAGQKVGSSALLANAWHQRTDALSSIPVVGAVVLSWLYPSLGFLDGVGAIVVSVFILFAAWRIVRPGLGKLADRSAPKEDVRKIETLASSVSGVREVHAVRTRFGGGLGLYVDMHVLVDGELSVKESHNIASAVQVKIKNGGLGVVDVVVHIEPFKNN